MLNVGDKVICIDDSHHNDFKGIAFKNWIKKDNEYTIRAIIDNDGIVTGILLEEIINPFVPIPILNKFQEPAFATWRFRKMKTISLDTHKEIEELIINKAA